VLVEDPVSKQRDVRQQWVIEGSTLAWCRANYQKNVSLGGLGAALEVG